MNDSRARATLSARVQQVINELHAARLNMANIDYAEAYKNLTYAEREMKLIRRRFREGISKANKPPRK
ncbi:hypothetical protein EWF69_18060 [Salmonella enterica subsp. enterica serovar Thompson]|nr:hypothetical protein [Salmonella enterica subsp. enterica serovar Thompson]EBW7959355.1 hypothetical protein [Salmonella enterica subsp. enterica serovar Thompson]ECD1771543.1 hypothetical protein [Salmonella enterica subsp. enterica serovar Thompson]